MPPSHRIGLDVTDLDVTDLDLRGLKCPLPVLRTRKALRELVDGARLAVTCTDPLAAIDIPHLVRADGHDLEGQTTGDGVVTFVIVKRRRARHGS